MNELYKEMSAINQNGMCVGAYLFFASELSRAGVLYKDFQAQFMSLSEEEKAQVVTDIINEYKEQE